MHVQGKTVLLLMGICIVLSSLATILFVSPAQMAGPSSPQPTPSDERPDNDHNDSSEEVFADQFAKIEQAFDVIRNHYVLEVDEQELLDGAIEGMMSALDDPYSVYMDAEEAAQFNANLSSTTFEGIGAEVVMRNERVTIISPIRGSPAEEAGLQANDRILSVDGESLEGLDINTAVSIIRGPKGSAVELEIQRPGMEDTFIIEVIRDEIPVQTVYTDTVEVDGHKIGILTLSSFAQGTAAEFEEGLTSLEQQGVDGLIIDVRSNPGGYLEAVYEIGKRIIPDQQMITRIENRMGEELVYRSTLEERKPYPMSVLINGGSASASEILAAAMQEGGGYPVIGESSFGKGTVQRTIQMDDASEIKITMAKWLTTNENWIDGEGVTPDLDVSQPDFFYSAPIQTDPPLEKDMNSSAVENLQVILDGIGYTPTRQDGLFDAGTEAVVEQFQDDHDLDVTGIVDEDTAMAIHDVLYEEINKMENDLQLQRALEEMVKAMDES